jgi:hydroxymethylpyrimidine pyrophosphatase-like HAD family hydrolase
MSESAARDGVLFAGDSPNDEPMFRFFPLSVGVANIRDAEHLIASKPGFVTSKRSGEGFVELAEKLLALRG